MSVNQSESFMLQMLADPACARVLLEAVNRYKEQNVGADKSRLEDFSNVLEEMV